MIIPVRSTQHIRTAAYPKGTDAMKGGISVTHELRHFDTPLFDHGNSLFSLAAPDDFENLDEYAETLFPSVYDDFIGTAKSVLRKEHRDALRRLLDFRFKKHSLYNLDDDRLKLIEEQVRKRAMMILK